MRGTQNHIFVRVTNRQAADVQATVQLFQTAFPAFARGTAWQAIGAAGGVTFTVPANSSRFTRPGLVFNAPANIVPGEIYKGVMLIALVLMVAAHRRGVRAAWMLGAGLLGLTLVKLFLVDLSNRGGAERIVVFIAVGVIHLLITIGTRFRSGDDGAGARRSRVAP